MTIHDLGETGAEDSKVPFLVMELIRGEGMDAILRRGAVTLSDAARWGAQICDALAEAHNAGIMHRDIKPSNTLIFRQREGPRLRHREGGRPLLDRGPPHPDRLHRGHTPVHGPRAKSCLGMQTTSACTSGSAPVQRYPVTSAGLPVSCTSTRYRQASGRLPSRSV
ncbi:protein kinase domain-containing protein [Streptomyces actinomycinicus]|uniref:protein kinase domain-containing protein n=1 Tax=Streptomyces actinomycinicus TaxID=1695166 RepID=UPI0027DA3EDD|nr:hypothetical protein [Streptomyces actinomycinicus]